VGAGRQAHRSHADAGSKSKLGGAEENSARILGRHREGLRQWGWGGWEGWCCKCCS